MTAEAAREFVDANVLVYAHDASAGDKKAVAEQLLTRLWSSGTGCLSIQVLQEFFVTVTRKVAAPLPIIEAEELIREFGVWRVFSPNVDDVLRAINLQQQSKVSFWDAMVVQAASELQCDVLWTEDLQSGQTIQGVRIQDPFLPQEPS